jgi:hypothetical protein
MFELIFFFFVFLCSLNNNPQIRCTAKIFDTYWEVTEKVILEERPKVVSSSSNSISYISKDTYDQPSQLDGEMSDNIYNIRGEWNKILKKLIFSSIFLYPSGDMSSLSGGSNQSVQAQSIQCYLVVFSIFFVATKLL